MSVVYNFCIPPYLGSTSFVMFSPVEKTFVSLTPVLELYKPEYINPFSRINSVSSVSVMYAFTPKSTCVLLYPPRILDSSTYQSYSTSDDAVETSSGNVGYPVGSQGREGQLAFPGPASTVFFIIKELKYVISLVNAIDLYLNCY